MQTPDAIVIKVSQHHGSPEHYHYEKRNYAAPNRTFPPAAASCPSHQNHHHHIHLTIRMDIVAGHLKPGHREQPASPQAAPTMANSSIFVFSTATPE